MNKRLEEMLRVDHAGEYGAITIYQGQLAIFRAQNNKEETVKLIEHMAEQEQEHLDYFNSELLKRKIRPTALAPFWKIAGFTLGAGSALIGENAAMACTEAVEDVIGQHYQEQINELDENYDEADLKDSIEKFCADEAEHHHIALEEGAEQAPLHDIVTSLIKTACRVAIKLSEKI